VTAAYNGSVALDNGKHLSCNRQRPKLLFNEKVRTPTPAAAPAAASAAAPA